MEIKLDSFDKIMKRIGLDNNGEVQKFLTNTCYRHMDKYVPYDTGNLRTNVIIDSDSITYNSPYAQYQYYGELYVDPETGSSYARKGATKIPTGKPLKYHTAGTGSYWDREMVSAEIDDIVKEVQNYMRR